MLTTAIFGLLSGYQIFYVTKMTQLVATESKRAMKNEDSDVSDSDH